MKITIIYDNQVYRKDLINKWGFACLIEVQDQPVLLFDTGGDGEILLHNMDQLGIDPAMIEGVFISHKHWDHTGGLETLLRKNSELTLFTPPSACDVINKISADYYRQEKIFTFARPCQFERDFFSTGELKGEEQALIVRSVKGLVVVVGCSHPGVETILDKAALFGKVYALIGGFHGFNNLAAVKGIELLCPTHCTEYQAELSFLYPEKCRKGGVGREINI